MKKILLVVAMVMAMMNVCFASDSDDFDEELKAAQPLISVIENKDVPAYTTATKGFSDDLKGKMDEAAYGKLPNEIQNKMGNLKEIKFYTFQRFDQGDRITYIASFDKEPTVAVVFLFDKQQKMTNFMIAPLQQQTTQQ